jgi:hypothetical protein
MAAGTDGRDNAVALDAVRALVDESGCGLDLLEERLLGDFPAAALLRLRLVLERVGALVAEAVDLAEGAVPDPPPPRLTRAGRRGPAPGAGPSARGRGGRMAPEAGEGGAA